MRRSVAFAVVAVAVLAAAAGTEGTEDPAHSAKHKSGPRFGSNVPSFFNQGENPLTFDADILADDDITGAPVGPDEPPPTCAATATRHIPPSNVPSPGCGAVKNKEVQPSREGDAPS
jgi:hypothetical protein